MPKRKAVEEVVEEISADSDVADENDLEGQDESVDANSDIGDDDEEPAASSPTAPKTAKSFADLGLNTWLVDALNALSIRTPSEIQTACVPPILSGMASRSH